MVKTDGRAALSNTEIATLLIGYCRGEREKGGRERERRRERGGTRVE
jgi:hypothetical protein